jgi:signal transduction histidine kinase
VGPRDERSFASDAIEDHDFAKARRAVEGPLGPSTRDPSVTRRFLSRISGRDRRRGELLRSLSDVAGAVSTAVSVEDVLLTIVDRAKSVTNTDKALLLLTHEDSEDLDWESLVVRGRRDQHLQETWQGLVDDAAPGVFANGFITLNSIPETKAWMAYAPIRMRSRRIGMLCAINSHDRRFNQQQMEFLAILGAFAATAVENARLAEESRYVLLSSERDRIARELHDGLSQSLFSISLGLELAKKQALKDPVAVSGRLGDLQEQLTRGMGELRRVIYDLRPVKLQELGLVGAVNLWVREATAGRDIVGTLEVSGEPRHIGPSPEACLYRVAKEAVSNAIRHSEATRFNVRVEYADSFVVLTVSDDGTGFVVEDATSNAPQGTGIGLRSMRERMAGEGGSLIILSAPGKGTSVRAELPTGR